MISPLDFVWSGEAMVPVNPRAADRQYTVGERYRLDVREDRSHASHSHFFATVEDAFANLPEDMTARFPTADTLRKYALVKSGFHLPPQSIVCASKAEAVRVLRGIGPDYDFATLNESTVTLFKAESQSYRAMGKQRFQDSKNKVLEVLADMLDVSPEVLGREAGRAA